MENNFILKTPTTSAMFESYNEALDAAGETNSFYIAYQDKVLFVKLEGVSFSPAM